MDVLAEPLTCRFDDFLLDREGHALYRLNTGGERTVVPIGSRALEILCFLIDRRGEFVSRREIMATVWPNAVVEESNLTVQMASLRRVLDAGRTHGSCIQTMPGRGYRFLPQIAQASSPVVDADVHPPLDGQLSASVATSPDHPGLKAAHRDGSSWRMPRLAGLAGATCLLVALLFAAYAWYCSSGSYPRGAYPRLSVAVLPFENLGGDVNDDRLADGITEDLTTDLSHIPTLSSPLVNLPIATRVKPTMSVGLARNWASATWSMAACRGSARRSGSTPSSHLPRPGHSCGRIVLMRRSLSGLQARNRLSHG